MKYTPISISPEQAQFLETRKFQINEIARIFRVPPHMVGDLEKSSFSNIEQQSLEFVKYTLDPWVIRWEQSIQRTLLSHDEKVRYFVKFNLEGLLRGDYQSRMNGYAIGRQNGWMSANDIRELENLDRIPTEEGGDLYLINGNMLPLKDAGEGRYQGVVQRRGSLQRNGHYLQCGRHLRRLGYPHLSQIRYGGGLGAACPGCGWSEGCVSKQPVCGG